uniref:Uncharacterized protein n=1 Tax=viral metagenome TaxID=1070528 RepID=A0A6C0E4R5_9ZZZZ
MSAQNETLTLNQAQVVPVESVVSFVDEKSMDVVVENQQENQPKTKKELKMTKKTKKLIVLCGKLYGFDGEEAITRLLNHEKPKKEKKAKEPRKRKSVASNPEDGEKKKRGRPAKTVKVVEESQVVDMFADIVSKDDVAPEEEEHVETPFETPVETKKVKKSKVLSEEEKAEKEAKKAQEKADKEAKKAQEKADKEAKKAQEKADKEAKKAEEKALKEAEKEAKKTEKPVKKSKAKAEKKAPESVESTPSVSDNESETEQEVFKVKKFEHKGVSYLRTRNGDNWHENGHIYNMVQDLVGFWNELNQDIQFVEEGECEEEEYDA